MAAGVFAGGGEPTYENWTDVNGVPSLLLACAWIHAIEPCEK